MIHFDREFVYNKYSLFFKAVQIENSLRPAWLCNAFDKFDHDNNGALTLTEIKNLLTHCNVKIEESKAEENFKV